MKVTSIENGEIIHKEYDTHPLYDYYKNPENAILEINYIKDSYIEDNQIVLKVTIQNDHSEYFRKELDFDLYTIGWEIISELVQC